MNPEIEHDRKHGIIRAMWCVDSETGREYLIDLYTQKIIAERINGRLVDPNPLEGAK